MPRDVGIREIHGAHVPNRRRRDVIWVQVASCIITHLAIRFSYSHTSWKYINQKMLVETLELLLKYVNKDKIGIKINKLFAHYLAFNLSYL